MSTITKLATTATTAVHQPDYSTIDFNTITAEFEAAKALLISMGVTGSAIFIGANTAVNKKLGIDCIDLTGIDPGPSGPTTKLLDLAHIERFLYSSCELNDSARVKRPFLYMAYRMYCDELDIERIGKKCFFELLQKKFRMLKNTHYYFEGLQLKTVVLRKLEEGM
ncbi:MAG: hypothetical protein V1793_25005 [Pseudomonadota bacterium]